MSLRLSLPPAVPDRPDLQAWLLELYLELQRIEGESRKLQRDVEVALANRLILHDAAGLRYVVSINPVGPAILIAAA